MLQQSLLEEALKIRRKNLIKTTLFQLSQSDLILKHTKVVTDAPPANSGMQITIPSEPKGVNEILPI